MSLTRYTKLDADGNELSAGAENHFAVRIEHLLLARPIIVTARKAPTKMTPAEGKRYCEAITMGELRGRLPTVEEAFFIPDRSKYPAMPKEFFPDLEEWECIWTSTADAEESPCAWFVILHFGDCHRDGQSNLHSVRAVLASDARAVYSEKNLAAGAA